MTVKEIQNLHNLSDNAFDVICERVQPLIDDYGTDALRAVLAWIAGSDAAEIQRAD